jgi:hypothetical protein
MPMRRWRTVSGILVALGLGVVLILWRSVGTGTTETDAGRQEPVSDAETTPDRTSYSFREDAFNPQDDPFLGDGQKVTLEQAKAGTSYDLAIPVTNEVTGELIAIWLDPNEQVAFVWESGLRMYVDQDPASETESVEAWEKQVADEPYIPYVLTEIQGHPAIGHDKNAKLPSRFSDGQGLEIEIDESGLTIVVGGTGVQFVSEIHSLDQLIDLGEQLSWESST